MRSQSRRQLPFDGLQFGEVSELHRLWNRWPRRASRRPLASNAHDRIVEVRRGGLRGDAFDLGGMLRQCDIEGGREVFGTDLGKWRQSVGSFPLSQAGDCRWSSVSFRGTRNDTEGSCALRCRATPRFRHSGGRVERALTARHRDRERCDRSCLLRPLVAVADERRAALLRGVSVCKVARAFADSAFRCRPSVRGESTMDIHEVAIHSSAHRPHDTAGVCDWTRRRLWWRRFVLRACSGPCACAGSKPAPASRAHASAERGRSGPLPDAGDLRSERDRDRTRAVARCTAAGSTSSSRCHPSNAPALRAGQLQPAAVRRQLRLHAGLVLAAGDSRARPVAPAREVRAVADRRRLGRERHDRHRLRRPRQLRRPARPARVRQLPRRCSRRLRPAR